MEHSPMTEYLKSLETGLKKLDIPILYKLPDESYPEPFIVIGNHSDDDSPSAKIGAAVVLTDIQIDVFHKMTGRAAIEDLLYKVKSCLGRPKSINSDILIDNSIGREVYHIVINLKNYVI